VKKKEILTVKKLKVNKEKKLIFQALEKKNKLYSYFQIDFRLV